jgi:hypothetical protein
MPTLSIEKSRNRESAPTQEGKREILCAKAAQGHLRYSHRQETAAVCCSEDRASRRQN